MRRSVLWTVCVSAACVSRYAEPDGGAAQEFRFDERLGVASVSSERTGCLAVVDPWLEPGTSITLVSQADNATQSVSTARIVSTSLAACDHTTVLGDWVGPKPTAYNIAQVDSAPVNGIAIAIVNPISPVTVKGGSASGDINGDGAAESYFSCSDGKRVALNVATGAAPTFGEPGWNRTVYLLHDGRPTCKIDFPSAAFTRALADSARRASIRIAGDAAALFSFDGKPIDARCLVGLGYLPVSTSMCARGTRPASNSYEVLATKWRRFLIASDGPDGSALQWVRYADGRIAMESTVLSGSGCHGHQSEFRVAGDSALFNVKMAAPEILTHAGLVLTAAARAQFQSSAQQNADTAACAGTGEFRYDLHNETTRLASLTLRGAPVAPVSPSADAPASGSLQNCFDRQAYEWAQRSEVVLTPPRVKEFGRAFIARCMTGPEFNQETTVEGAWSPVVDGLRGRLVLIGGSDSLRRAQLKILLDLENVRNDSTPIGIWLMFSLNNQVVPLTLVDESGQEMPRLRPAGSEGNGPKLLSIPARDTIRTPFMGGYAYAMDPPRICLRPSTFVAWDIASVRSQLYLRGAVTPYVSPDSSKRGWAGTLQLPQVGLPPR